MDFSGKIINKHCQRKNIDMIEIIIRLRNKIKPVNAVAFHLRCQHEVICIYVHIAFNEFKVGN